ncbi:hypothetical protein RHMOL_Rhmol06G0165800 [Rhododendron molle]|uniref:Uncharacterized protein n=1 Tax=Rhododendron molle TaxID=49168 RepID=A0ACC0NF23_RHOML|nr:hypothetical protein RHMOL_Rhmol06G0165800 [Rhododendron molle]
MVFKPTSLAQWPIKKGDGKPVKERWGPAKRGGAEEWWRGKRRPCGEEGGN